MSRCILCRTWYCGDLNIMMEIAKIRKIKGFRYPSINLIKKAHANFCLQ